MTRRAAHARRPRIRMTDLKAALSALKQAGRNPCALDILPDGTQRWHFTKPVEMYEDDLDRELAEFEAKHGEG